MNIDRRDFLRTSGALTIGAAMPPFTAPLARGDEAIKPARPIATEYSVDFRKVTSLPRDVVPSQACPQTNLSLIVIDGDQALSVGSSGIASPLGLEFKIVGLSHYVDAFPYLSFHFRAPAPKAPRGKFNLTFRLTINGIETKWNNITDTGALHLQLAADKTAWTRATIDFQPLLDHWREQTGIADPMFVEAIHIGLGVADAKAEQSASALCILDFHLGSPFARLGIDQTLLANAAFTTTVDAWISQGEAITLLPTQDGIVCLAKKWKAGMGAADLTKGAARIQRVVAGKAVSIDTAGLDSGTYLLALLQGGVVESQLQIHLAFKKIPVSPDYEVVVNRSGVPHALTTYHSVGLDEYVQYGPDFNPDNIVSFRHRPVVAHSWAALSTDDYPVTVRVRVKPQAREISIPLKSAKVLPSSYGIPCKVENGDTIVFTLHHPEKVFVIANYDQAMEVYARRAAGHVSMWNLTPDFRIESPRNDFRADNPILFLSEGFRNPFVFLGRKAEHNLPDADAPGTLIVYPGEQPTQKQLDAAKTVWFKPGPHDFSRLGEWPLFHVYITSGQTFYLEEGAWLLARIVARKTSDRYVSQIVGRGTVSGINHFWGGGGFQDGSQIAGVDKIAGINVTDRAYFGIQGGELIEDIAMLGAWHWNTGALDSLGNCTVRNCLLTADDDNVHLNHHTWMEHVVIMMLGTNGHPIMVKEILTGKVFAESVVRDIDIVAYYGNPKRFDEGWRALAPGAIACVTGSDLTIKDFTFSDIRIESPFLYRVFSFYNMDTNRDYAAPWFWNRTNEDFHTRIDGVKFNNISVFSPLIVARSVFGSGYRDSLKNVSFTNLQINGVRITERNQEEYLGSDNNCTNNISFHTSIDHD